MEKQDYQVIQAYLYEQIPLSRKISVQEIEQRFISDRLYIEKN
ncbi:hypothetical protein [Pleurocapsa sp. PCC 7319]|nr:hypothetical protein [Pleurocapsa sp. PCC 7319]